MDEKKEKKGFSKGKLILILIIAALVFMGILYFKMKWKQFQASANFVIWWFVIIVVVCLIVYLKLRSNAKKKREAKRQEAIREAAELAEQEEK